MSGPLYDMAHDTNTEMHKWHCCETMAYHAEFRCDRHSDPFDCPENIVHYDHQSRTYGLIIHDGGGSFLDIDYCPWCGTMLKGARHSGTGGWPIQ